MSGEIAQFDIKDSQGNVIVEQGQRINARRVKQINEAKLTRLSVPDEYLYERVLAEDIVIDSEVVAYANQLIDHETLIKIINADIDSFGVLFTNDIDHGSYIADTLRADTVLSREEALIEIYKVMRPGEPPTVETAEKLFEQMFLAKNAMIYPMSVA